MWPWGHLGVGYLLLVAFARLDRRRPTGGEAIAVGIGTQLPDLVDKPLAWTLALLPNGRSLGHSLLVAVVLVALVWLACRRFDRSTAGVAFGIGYLSHLFGDGLYHALAGEWYYLGFLGWPLVPPVSYGTDKSFLAHFAAFELTPRTGFELAVFGLAVLLWVSDGMPGLSWARRTISRPIAWVR